MTNIVQSHDLVAQRAISKLLNGASPNGETPLDLGPWWPVYATLADAHRHDGTSGVQEAYNVITRGKDGQGLIKLLASNPAPVAPVQPGGVPELPATARAIAAYTAPCGHWFDLYVDFAAQAAPMTPRSFHEAAALYIASVVIARRLVLRVSTTQIFPNLYLLCIAPSTVYSKSSGLQLIPKTFQLAGIEHLLLPSRMTPEAWIQELGISLPATFNSWDEQTRTQWIAERAFAAQRGWVLDEASSLFDGLKKDFNVGLLPLILNLYECPERTTEQTIGRGRVTVHRAYLSFFGAATPSGLNEHLMQATHWTNGLWARFALITPDTPPVWAFFPPEMPFPSSIIDGVQRLAGLFASPEASLEEQIVNDEKRKAVIVRGGAPEPASVSLSDGVWDAWKTYTKAVRHDLLVAGLVDSALHASYGRLAVQAIKVAMLLAAMDTPELPVRVERRHFARAQQIVECWRANLHLVWSRGVATEEAQQIDKVRELLSKAGPDGLFARDVYRSLNLTSSDVYPLLEELERSGDVTRVDRTAANGRKVERWVLVPSQGKGEVS